MKKALLALAIATTLATPSAFASDSGWYLLGGYGGATSNTDQATLDNSLTSAGGKGFTSSLTNPSVYGLGVGYKVKENVAIEGGYIGSTNETYNASGGNLIAAGVSATATVTGEYVSVVGFYPATDKFSLLGKLGVASITDNMSVTTTTTTSLAGSKADLTYGIGAQYEFTDAFFGRFQIDSYNIGTSTSATRTNVWEFAVGYRM